MVKGNKIRNPSNFPVRGHGPLRTMETAKSRGTKGDESLLNSREGMQRRPGLHDMDWTWIGLRKPREYFVWLCFELTND